MARAIAVPPIKADELTQPTGVRLGVACLRILSTNLGLIVKR